MCRLYLLISWRLMPRIIINRITINNYKASSIIFILPKKQLPQSKSLKKIKV